MSSIPKIKLNIKTYIYTTPDDGKLIYEYRPFHNQKMGGFVGEADLTSLTLDADKAEISIDRPIELNLEESYDGSVNVIVNDRVNPLKIVNSRFYLIDSNNYKIGDRKGNLDTNIYTEKNFKVEANLVKSVQSVIGLDFLGLLENGNMKVGNYTFYFKLSDSDGNESDFIAESGKVVCHIGNISKPRFIRGGQMGENSGKSVRFRLKNIDLAYNYIHVYYTRSTGDSGQEITTAHKIEERFKISGIDTEIAISGYEEHTDVSLEDINVRYSEFNSVKTTTNCQNITFAGGVSNEYEVYKMLEKLSLFITPSIVSDKEIGNLAHNYKEKFNEHGGYEYYNVDNIYYKLGY